MEALQGENARAFAHLAEDDNPLPERDGPRAYVGWVKLAPPMEGPHALQLGAFYMRGVHQEAHLGDEGNSDPNSHWLDGHQWLAGGDVVYRYTPNTAYGWRWVTVEGGYIYREKDIELIAHNNPLRSRFVGQSLVSQQDGFHLQGTYGFAPRWRFGLRGEMVGLTNETSYPSGASESFDETYRWSAMVDWTLTEFSRIRFQFNRGGYATEEGREKANEFFIQAVFSLGAHGAHKF